MTTTATTLDNVVFVFIAQPKSSVDLRKVAGHGIELVKELVQALSLRPVILADLDSYRAVPRLGLDLVLVPNPSSCRGRDTLRTLAVSVCRKGPV